MLPARPLSVSSMSPTNTVSTEAGQSAPGTPSEATGDVAARTPGFDLPELTQPTVVVSGSGSPSPGPWTRPGPQSGPWRQAADTPSSSLQPRDADSGKWVEQ